MFGAQSYIVHDDENGFDVDSLCAKKRRGEGKRRDYILV
jgi:hypothetical protein